jgi:hypothetical protein
MRGGRGGAKGSRGWLPGQTDRLVESSKALGIAAGSAAAAESLPPPLFPERSLRPFRWYDSDGSDLWLLQKAEELGESFSQSPYNLDAPPSAESLQQHAQARTAAVAAGQPAPAPPLAGSARLLEHLACVRHTHAFPLELVVSRKQAQRAAARGGGGRGGHRGSGAVQHFLRAMKNAKAVAGGAAQKPAGEGGEEAGEEDGDGERAAEEE